MIKSIQNIEIFNPSKIVKSFKPEGSDRVYNGRYYALGKYPDESIWVSENRNIQTMHFAQNWKAQEVDIIYE